MRTSLPVDGDMIEVDLPDGHWSCIAQTIIATALAYTRFQKQITNPARWAAAIVSRHAEAASAGTLHDEHRTMKDRRRKYAFHSVRYPGIPIADLCLLFVSGQTRQSNYTELMGQAKTLAARSAFGAVIGHVIVKEEGCGICDVGLTSPYDWSTILFKQDVPDQAIYDLYSGLRAARIVPSIESEDRAIVIPGYEDCDF